MNADKKYIEIPYTQKPKDFPLNLLCEIFRIPWIEDESGQKKFRIPANCNDAVCYRLYRLMDEEPLYTSVWLLKYREKVSEKAINKEYGISHGSIRRALYLLRALLWKLPNNKYPTDVEQWTTEWAQAAAEDANFDPINVPLRINPKVSSCILLVSRTDAKCKTFLNALSTKYQSNHETAHPEEFFQRDFLATVPEEISEIYFLDGLSDEEAKMMIEQLIRVPVRFNDKHALIDFIPFLSSLEPQIGMKLRRQDYYWLIRKINIEDGRIIF